MPYYVYRIREWIDTMNDLQTTKNTDRKQGTKSAYVYASVLQTVPNGESHQMAKVTKGRKSPNGENHQSAKPDSTIFNPSGIKRSAKKSETGKERNARRKASKRVKAARAATAQEEAVNAVKYEKHLTGAIMTDLERLYGKRYTRAAGNMRFVLEEVEMFSTDKKHLKASY